MIRLTVYTDPFDTTRRTTEEVAYRPGTTLLDYLPAGLDPVAMALDGVLAHPHTPVTDGQAVMVCTAPMGLNRADYRMLAQMGLIAASIAFPAASPYLLIGGGVLMSFLAPGVPKDLPPGWDVTGNADAANGLPMPVTYGTVRVRPTLKDRFVVQDGDKSRLSALFSFGCHQVDSITGIEVNGEALTHYTDVNSETKLGTLDQTACVGFGETYTDYPVGVNLPQAYWYDVTLTEDYAHGFRVDLVYPYGQGLGTATGSKKLHFLSITYSTDGGDTWLTPTEDATADTLKRADRIVNGEAKWGSNDSRPSQRSYIFRIGARAQIKVRVSWWYSTYSEAQPIVCTLANVSSVYFPDYTGLTGVTSFRYPGEPLLALRALATDQLSGDVEVSAILTRSTVKVWDDTLDTPAWVDRDADNPAWAIYDMLANGHPNHPAVATDGSEYGAGYPPARLPYSRWEAFATHCTAIGATCNVHLSTETSVWEAVQQLAALGRGGVRFENGNVVPVWDAVVATPTQLFSEGNIEAGSFSLTWVPSSEMADTIEVSFLDRDRDWEETTVVVHSASWDEGSRVAPIRISLVGCTSYAQALGMAQYLLRRNRHVGYRCEWQSDIDAISCLPGDVVRVQHQLPGWGLAGGRVLSARRNLLDTDGGFEAADLTAWDQAYTVGYPDTYEVSTTRAHSGTQSYHHVEATTAGCGIQHLVTVTRGRTYAVSCWVWATASTIALYLHGSSYFTTASAAVPADKLNRWHRLTIITTIEAGAGTTVPAAIQLRGIGEAWFDDVLVEEAATVGEYIEGDVVTLDRAVTLAPGTTYALRVRPATTDAAEAKTITADAGTTAEVRCLPFTTLPAFGDIYTFGEEGDDSRLVRITSIAPDSDLTSRLTGEEYNPAIFTGEPITDIRQTSRAPFPTAIGLGVTERAALQSTIWLPVVDLAWRTAEVGVRAAWAVYVRDLTGLDSTWRGIYSGATTYALGDAVLTTAAPRTAYLSLAAANTGHALTDTDWWAPVLPDITFHTGGVWAAGTTYSAGDVVDHGGHAWVARAGSNTNHEPPSSDWWAPLLEGGWRILPLAGSTPQITDLGPFVIGHTYEYAVAGRTPTGREQALTATPRAYHTVTGKAVPPSAVAFDAVNSVYHETVRLYWTPISDPDLDYYILRTGTTGWDAATEVTRTKSTSYMILSPGAGASRTYYIKAVDTAGNLSTTAGSITLTNGDPAIPTNFAAAGVGTDILLTWTNPTDADFVGIRVYEGTVDDYSLAVHVATTGTGEAYRRRIGSYGATRYYWLRAYDTAGNLSGWTGAGGAGLVVTTAQWQPAEIGVLAADNIGTDTMLGKPARSAATGARVEFNYPAGVGLGVIDDAGAYVFRAYIAGAGDPGIGDVIIGGASQYVKWDKSAATLSIRGLLNADDIVAGTITGRTVQTAASGQRVVVSGADNSLAFYDSAGVTRVLLDDAIYSGLAGMKIANGAIYLGTDDATIGYNDLYVASTPTYAKVRVEAYGNRAANVSFFAAMNGDMTAIEDAILYEGLRYGYVSVFKVHGDGKIWTAGALDVDGNADIAGTFDGHGAGRFYSTLQVDGLATLSGGVKTKQVINVSDDPMSASLLDAAFGSSMGPAYIGVIKHAYSSTIGLVVRIDGVWYKLNGTLVT